MLRPWLLALLLLSPQAAPPKPQGDTDVLGIPEMYGYIRVSLLNSGTVTETLGAGQTTTSTWDEKDELFIDARLDRRSNSASVYPPAVPGATTERGRYQSWYSDPDRKGPHAIIVRGEGQSKTVADTTGEARSRLRDTDTMERTRHGSAQTRINLNLQADRTAKTYAFAIPIGVFTAVPVKGRKFETHRDEQFATGIDDTTTNDSPYTALGIEIDPSSVAALRYIEEPLPTGTTTLKGTRTIPLVPLHKKKGVGKIDVRAVVEWSFSPKPPDRYELELEARVETGGDFSTWRPLPGPDELSPGSILVLTARLKGPHEANSDYPTRIALRLTEVSHEKGVSLNFPEKPMSPSPPDLQFMISTNPKISAFGKYASTLERDATELTVRLGCYDAGAWGEVVAECDLASGRFIQGKVKDRPGETSLLVPEREPGRKIAASWHSPGADDADDDAQPAGDAVGKGDGLTNYEEYRGFHVKGVWKEGDPNRKDFFVRDETAGFAEPGIALFESLSQLRVHRLEASEFPKSRIINANRTEGPHVVDQHGIRILYDAAFGGWCQAVSGNGRPGLPKDNNYVILGDVPLDMVDTAVSGGPKKPMSYLAPSVAHELFHCCNVYHHGDPPGEGTLRWRKLPGNVINEGNKRIVPVDEAGNDLSAIVDFPLDGGKGKEIDIGLPQGKYSGDVGCVMRYDTARGRIDPAQPDRRILFPPGAIGEAVGGGLCTSSDGVPANAHFGPSAANRGACKQQIVVNDAAKVKPK